MKIRCKFVCLAKEPAWQGATDHFKVTFGARYDTSIPEDARFQQYTPSGNLEATISNPAALAAIEVGKSYYVDITPADAPPSA